MNENTMKFKINRSQILKRLLIKRGWVEANENDNIDFSYYDIYKNKHIRDSKVSVIPRYITNVIDNKMTMYITLFKNNQIDFLPKTYTNLRNIDLSIFNQNKILFLKHVSSAGGKCVYQLKTYDRMREIINNNYSNYILQEEVPNMMLHDGSKTSLRLYVLILDKKHIYLYKNGKALIYRDKYDSDNLDNKIHNNTYGLNAIHTIPYIETDYYEDTFDKIKELSYRTCMPFIKDKTFENKFIIFGIDIILDIYKNPYLIEVNAYPDLSEETNNVKGLITNMLSDFIDLYIEPKINNEKPKQGDWVLCNPVI